MAVGTHMSSNRVWWIKDILITASGSETGNREATETVYANTRQFMDVGLGVY